MLNKYMEILKKAIDAFLTLGNKDNTIADYFNTVGLEFLVLLIGLGILIAAAIIVFAPVKGTKSISKFVNKHSVFGAFMTDMKYYYGFLKEISLKVRNRVADANKDDLLLYINAIHDIIKKYNCLYPAEIEAIENKIKNSATDGNLVSLRQELDATISKTYPFISQTFVSDSPNFFVQDVWTGSVHYNKLNELGTLIYKYVKESSKTYSIKDMHKNRAKYMLANILGIGGFILIYLMFVVPLILVIF